MDVDVLVVGAGPTGMALAGELRLAGAPVLLVDRLARRSALSKAGGVQSRVLEVFDQRGLLEPLLATGDHPTGAPHFAGVALPLTGARRRHPWRSIPQVVVEGVLEQHLAERGVHVRREHELTALAQDGESVTATFAGGAAVRCRYLVAADGAHSTVRSLLAVGFPGRPGTRTVVAADVRLAGHDSTSTHTRGADGNWASVFPLGVDQRERPLHRLSFGGPGRSLPRERPVTEDEIRDGLRAVFGDRVRLLDLRYARRITNAARQVENYRHGRVLLAGDAAHAHLPIGAQGMNTGIGDAVNLGWKLAGAVHGWAPEHLLDTYHAERHPVGAAVLRNVQAQSLLMDQEGAADPDLIAARDLFTDLAHLPQVQHHLDDVLSGTGIRYPMPNAGADPLVGLPAPDHDLGPVRSHELLRSGRGLLLDPTTRFADVAAPWGDRVDRAGEGTAVTPVLIRPDGYTCWTAGRHDDARTLGAALRHWFGDPR
ncbi:FAD-dependent monooxygenase [Actinosynnema pretiosum]|uniref:3-(3-hydroxyphenyl)propionate hydroxylase n=1 Tax=Actinosynnema pretiosum TaxID=42197 RepID=A0A290Z6C4_9PSEU|nr:FAD-dependent monooxygenase [Actinosynnema pretiosum]ATE54570.1 3-(3-hydroxyphenyl)propionate hydroxylase [Actinosynnema pretiosum]